MNPPANQVIFWVIILLPSEDFKIANLLTKIAFQSQKSGLFNEENSFYKRNSQLFTV